MSTRLQQRITLRLDDTTNQMLEALAAKRGESVSEVARRILTKNLQSEIALDAQDVLIAAVRKAIAAELRQTENRLASLSAKAAISASTAEYIASYITKLCGEPNVQGVRDTCRKRAVAYVKEPLEQIMAAGEGVDA